MNIEELIELLQNGEVEKAKKGFEELYQKNNDKKALYYLCIIELETNPNCDFQDIMQKFDYLLKSFDVKMIQAVIVPYCSLALSIDDYDKCLQLGKLGRRFNFDSYLVNMALAKGLMAKGKYQNAIDEAKEALLKEDIDERRMLLVNDFIVDTYMKMNDVKNAELTLANLALSSSNRDFINYMYLKFYIKTKNQEEIEKMPDFSTSDFNDQCYSLLAEYYFDKEDYKKSLYYTEKLAALFPNDYSLDRRRVLNHVYLNEKEEAIKIISKYDNEDSNYILGNLYYDLEDYKTSEKYYLRSIEHAYNENVMLCLGDVYVNEERFDKLQEVVDKLKYSKNPYVMYFKIELAKHYQDYDFIEKNLYVLIQNRIRSLYEIAFYAYISFKNVSKSYPIFRKLFEITSSKREKIYAYLYGDFSYEISLDKAEELIKEVKEDELYNCLLSVIGNYYLITKNYEKAFEYFKLGYERYHQKIDTCSCSVSFYLYCYLKGIVVTKDVEKVFNECKEIIQNDSNTAENIYNLYAESALILNKDLEEVFDKLTAFRERRYPISQLFMIRKVGNALGKNVKKYDKQFAKALKNVSLREREFYLNNVENTFLMNNY